MKFFVAFFLVPMLLVAKGYCMPLAFCGFGEVTLGSEERSKKEEQADTLIKHANMLAEVGRYQESYDKRKEAFSLLIEVYGEYHSKFPNILFDLGSTAAILKKHDESLRYKLQAEKLYKLLEAEEPVNLARIQNNIGITLVDLGRYEEALDYYKNSLKLSKKFDIPYETARVLTNIGKALRRLQRYEEALEFTMEALEIRKEVTTGKSVEVSDTLESIGVIYFYLQDQEKSIEFHEEALNMRREIYGEKHNSIARALNNIGISLERLGRREEALRYKMEALEMKKKLLGNRHPDLLSNLNSTIYTLKKMNRFAEADILNKQMLEIKLAMAGL